MCDKKLYVRRFDLGPDGAELAGAKRDALQRTKIQLCSVQVRHRVAGLLEDECRRFLICGLSRPLVENEPSSPCCGMAFVHCDEFDLNSCAWHHNLGVSENSLDFLRITVCLLKMQ